MDHSSPPEPQSRRQGAQASATLTSMTLIERVRARDDEAWRRLVELYSPLIRHWCRRRGVRAEDVDDVVQDVFQAVSVSLPNFRRDGRGHSFRGWLHGVTRHKALSLIRRDVPPGLGGTDFLDLSLNVPDPAAEAPDAEEKALIGELYQNALNLVRIEFEDRTWEAFWKTAIEGKPTADVAKEFGVTPAAVRQSRSRVLRRLKDLVGEPPID